MHSIHGSWFPDDAHEFIQRGAFYLWVETDTPVGTPTRGAGAVHPRHLAQADLAAFLVEKLGLRDSLPGNFCTKYFLLPTTGGKPAPSFELLRYVDEEEPIEFELAPWQVWCYKVPDVITTLNDMHFIALHAAEDFQLGSDFVFWHQYTQELKAIITKDQYIPAFKYRAIPSATAVTPTTKAKNGSITTSKKAKSASATATKAKDAISFHLHPAWELLSETYEKNIQLYTAAMPGICTAGMHSPDGAVALFDAESLLRHFSECLLHTLVTETPFTAKFDQQVEGTLLHGCIHLPQAFLAQASASALEDYKHWLVWRANLTRAHTESGFTLSFRLEEASASDIDRWHLHFLVSARSDPSLKLNLDDYWYLNAQTRAEVVRYFGRDFEKNLLLALGYAARIYPKIWDGLATDHPTGCDLTLEEAFAFLKESAWVLEDAGYSVIVPAWWTPEGRRRTKVRLKTALRSSKSKGSTANAQGYFSMDTLVAYQYQLSVGGQVVTPEEWQQLVDAKTPLVQFRGEWMELDRDKMQQLLEFWQTHQHEAPEVTLQELLKIGTESEDDMEWEHDQALQDMLARLHDKNAFAPVADPLTLQGTLREYQKRGVAWLQYLEGLGLNPCLADDMGLGKTLEVISCLLKEREQTEGLPPTLVIAPTSVIGNWHKEIERFAPSLRALVHQGGTRMKEKQVFTETCQAHDVVLTSFALARLDEKLLQGMKWHRVVVDEAQNIKNPQAAQTRAILKLSSSHRLALTGTPVENRLRDLWSIFNFLNPGYLGKEAQFRKTFETPINKDNDSIRLITLKRLVEPFILRRVKTDKRIINDLPDKIEQKIYCTLTPEQASLYEAVVKDVEERIQEAEGIQRRGLILATLLKLKQICNHPAQFLQDGSAFASERSHKFQRIGEMIEEALS
ncbi:MAG TPA: DEAD/DEAH box helicase, partial [Ktedonobacteraceae bacterium]|nr:DEAD/DEAH box helicase [Ktedonobacteraceae bacterium]